MRPDQIQRKPSLLGFLLTAITIFASIYYIIVALNTNDAMWFWPVFSESPEEIAVYCYGEEITLTPDEIPFNVINNAVNETLTGKKWWDQLTMSRDSFRDYQQSEVMLTLHLKYAEPIRIHTDKKFYSNVDDLIIPLIGRHSEKRSVFSLVNGNPGAGSIHVDSMDMLRGEVERLGVCP